MEPIDFWKLSEELSVVQAALLIVDIDPSEVQQNVNEWNPGDRPTGYNAVYSALKNAIRSQSLSATIRRDSHELQYGEEIDEMRETFVTEGRRTIVTNIEPNWHLTVVKFDDLRDWLQMRNFKTNFFSVGIGDSADEFLDSNSPYYAPKLAAAISAWRAITGNPELLKDKQPKAAIEKWLRQNANRFGLNKDDGNPNNHGIEEVCKIANWNLLGGASKTPSKGSENPPTPSVKSAKKPEIARKSTDTARSLHAQ